MVNVLLGRSGAPLRVLCLGAHSDDLEIGCGGAVLALLAARRDVCVDWIVFSAADERADEARAGAMQFLAGAAQSSVHIEGFRDGFFPYVGGEIKQYFERLKGRCKPDLIFTHYRDDRHQDHRLLSELTWNTFRRHLILEYEIPKYDGDFGTPNLFVPLDEAICRRKVQAITSVFQTQQGRHWFTAETFMGVLRLRGMEAASPTGYAEAFYCRKVVVDFMDDRRGTPGGPAVAAE